MAVKAQEPGNLFHHRNKSCVYPGRGELFPKRHSEKNKQAPEICSLSALVFKMWAPFRAPAHAASLLIFQLPFSPAIIQLEVEQLLGLGHPHILSVTLLQDIMYRGAPTTPPPSYLHSQLWTQALRGLHLRLHLLTTSAREEFQLLRHCSREHRLPTPSSHQAHS